MTSEMGHVEFDELNDFVDGRLSQSRLALVSEHIEMCGACRSEHDNLLALIRATQDLPRSVLPDGDLWPELRRDLNSRKEAVLRPAVPGGAAPATRSMKRVSIWRSGPFMAAAAIVLMVVSSVGTVGVLRTMGWVRIGSDSANVPAPKSPNRAPTALWANFTETEVEYARTIEDLQVAVNLQRGSLSPETIRTVDHSLAVVDSAIKEARAALLADPNNEVLVDLLSASYQRKLDLLRRTSELGSRI